MQTQTLRLPSSRHTQKLPTPHNSVPQKTPFLRLPHQTRLARTLNGKNPSPQAPKPLNFFFSHILFFIGGRNWPNFAPFSSHYSPLATLKKSPRPPLFPSAKTADDRNWKSMRSPAEIKFRLRQESANIYLAIAKPRFTGQIPSRLPLPNPQACAAALRGSLFEFTVLAAAQNILAHRFPVLGNTLETGPAIAWRRDYQHHKTSAAKYFRLVPYLNFAAVGDHKFIWELNRHQHLVLLAQAHLLTGKPQYLNEIFAQLESWLQQNPFQRGINWASALEVAFRALSWIWLWHFCGEAMPPQLRERFLTSLYQHGRHLFENLSIYFSPNTHLLGEAVALHALGTLFPTMHGALSWQRRGAQVVEAQLKFQVKPDGSHFEQSSYYHVYALDLFVFYYLLAGRPARLNPPLLRMAKYLHWLLGPARRIAYFGDDDGGRVFHPQGERDQFGRATLATCGVLLQRDRWLGTRDALAEQAAWWLGQDALSRDRANPVLPRGSKLFPNAGAAFLQSKDLFIQFDAGPFGGGGAGHSHADSLSMVIWYRGEQVFQDPGTFTYMADPTQRDRFRGTPAHNTISINGLNQAETAGPFRWNQKPVVELRSFIRTEHGGFIDAICEYRRFQHRRRLRLQDEQIIVLDEITGPPGEHLVEQVWNLGPAAQQIHLSFSEPADERPTEFSPAYGAKLPARALIVRRKSTLPVAMVMSLSTKHKAELTVVDARHMFDNEVSNPLINKEKKR